MRHKLLSLFILTSIFFTTAAYSATYYVATNGSASGNGSSGSPWTLERAGEPGSNAAPASGDTVIVKNGTYTATVRGGF
ncbi:MAG: hypothetical protein J6332_02850, partial [Abditibacteriota bacterium]|nr:hypothetical protein [Abditibacteriota bacterium]